MSTVKCAALIIVGTLRAGTTKISSVASRQSFSEFDVIVLEICDFEKNVSKENS